MNLTLTRKSYNSWGVVSELCDDKGEMTFVTLEHAYESLSLGAKADSTSQPKIPPGTYTCVLGDHNLEHSKGVKLYEVTKVPGHTGICLHSGNRNADSDGCVLVGTALGDRCITGSRTALETLMKIQDGKDFTLTVIA